MVTTDWRLSCSLVISSSAAIILARICLRFSLVICNFLRRGRCQAVAGLLFYAGRACFPSFYPPSNFLSFFPRRNCLDWTDSTMSGYQNKHYFRFSLYFFVMVGRGGRPLTLTLSRREWEFWHILCFLT